MSTSIIDKYKVTRGDIDNQYKQRVETCDKAYEFIEAINRLLLKNWKWDYSTYGTVYISNNGNINGATVSALEFREVCKHTERITSQEVIRSAISFIGGKAYLRGECYWKGVQIQIQLGNPDCKVTYVTKQIPAATIREVVVPKECLGIKEVEAVV